MNEEIKQFKIENKTLLKSPLSYMGSKKDELFKIVKNQPLNFNKVIDVYGGGGSVSLFYLQKYPFLDEVVYNDLNLDIINFFEVLTDASNCFKLYSSLEDFRNKEKISEEELNEKHYNFVNSPIDDKVKHAFDYFILKRYAFRSLIFKNKNPLWRKRINKNTGVLTLNSHINKIPDLYKYYELFKDRNFKINKKDAYELCSLYKDDENAFLYLDPPYIKCQCDEYGKNDGSGGDTLEILNILKDTSYKCKIMIHIEFEGYSYLQLKDFIKEVYPVCYNINRGKPSTKHLLIATNY